MTELRKKIVDAARSYKGVKFLHDGRSRSGMDCAGLLILVGRDLGLTDYDHRGYSRSPSVKEMGRELRRVLIKTTWRKADFGDVIWAASKDEYSHVGILADGGRPFSIIHAFERVGKVVENRIDEAFAKKIVGVFSYPGVL